MNRVINFLFGRNNSSSQDSVRQKIDTMLAAGQPLHVNKEAPLSTEDISFLSKEVRKRSILIIIVFAVIGVLFAFLAEGGGKLIGYGAFVLLFPVVWYQQKEMKRVLSESRKQIIRGFITKKFTQGSNRNGNSITYFLTLGEINLTVERNCYKHFEEGDAAEFHTVEYPARTTFVISYSKIVGAGIQ
jgi:hypothetical protein